MILGLGAGSVIDIIQRQYGFDPKITAIEIDKAIIDVLPYWNNLNLNNTTIVCDDAFLAVERLTQSFDLIIVDLFMDLHVHPSIHKKEFILQLKSLLTGNGRILINYVTQTKIQKEQFAEFQLMLMEFFKDIKGYNVLGMNRVLELRAT